MRSVVTAWLCASLLAGSYGSIWTRPAYAGDVLRLEQGTPVPTDGYLLDLEAARVVGDRLNALTDAQALVETQRAELAVRADEADALRAQVEALKAEAAARAEAMIRADEREKLRAEQREALGEVLKETKEMIAELRKDNERLRRQAQWDRVLGAIPLVGLAVMLFTGGVR